MAQTEKPPAKEGRIEKLARWNANKGIWLVGGLAVGAVLLPPAGAAVAATLAAGAGVETVGSKFVHERSKQRRLRKQKQK